MLIWGVLALLGGMSGNTDILRPLPLDRASGLTGANITTRGSTVGTDALFQKVHSNAELDRHLADAAAAGKPVLIDYYADWCNDCVRMENTTFAEPGVRQLLGDRFVVLKIDVTDPNDPDASALKSRYGVFGPPATLFISPSGTLLKEFNFYGYRNSADLLTILDNVLKQT
jgi:thiol:disulfide interchange protein DsbD